MNGLGSSAKYCRTHNLRICLYKVHSLWFRFATYKSAVFFVPLSYNHYKIMIWPKLLKRCVF